MIYILAKTSGRYAGKKSLMHFDDERSKTLILLPGLLQQQNNVEELHKLLYKGITGLIFHVK